MSHTRIYTNTIAQIAAKVLTALISIFLIKILTEYLSMEGYGMYAKVYNYLSIFAVIADLGLYTITVREISQHRDDPDRVERILGNTLTLRTILGVIIIILSTLLALRLPGYHDPMVLVAIVIAGGFTLLGLINSSLMTYLQAHLQTERVMPGVVGGKIVTFGLIALFALSIAPGGEWSDTSRFIFVFIAGLIGNLVMTIYTYIFVRRLIRVRFHYDIAYIRDIIRKSLPYGIALFLNVIFFKVDILLLSFLEARGVSDLSIALYSVPMKIVEVGMMYGTVFLNSLLPELSSMLKEEKTSPRPSPLLRGEGTRQGSENISERFGHPSPPRRGAGGEVGGDRAGAGGEAGGIEMEKKSRLLIYKGFCILLFFGLGISSFLWSYAAEILQLIASEKYLQPASLGYSSLDVMQIVVWIFVLYFLSSLSTYIMIARGDEARMLWINGSIALLNIIGNLILIPYYSFYGAAIATIVSQILLLALTMYFVREMFDWRKLALTVFYFSTLSLISMGLVSFLDSSLLWDLIGGVVVFSVVYLGGGIFWWRKFAFPNRSEYTEEK